MSQKNYNQSRQELEQFREKLYQKLRIAQKELSRKTKGSNNRHKARLKVAKIHAQIKDARTDCLGARSLGRVPRPGSHRSCIEPHTSNCQGALLMPNYSNLWLDF